MKSNSTRGRHYRSGPGRDLSRADYVPRGSGRSTPCRPEIPGRQRARGRGSRRLCGATPARPEMLSTDASKAVAWLAIEPEDNQALEKKPVLQDRLSSQ